MTDTPRNTVGFASDTTHPVSAPSKRTRWQLLFSFLEGFVVGFVLATAVLFLVYFGILWKVNRDE